MGLRLAVLFAGSGLLALLVYLQRPQDESAYLGNNLLVFALVNLNLIVLCILAFLVGRNVVKLIFDRRRNILGSKLRMRLVVAFVGLALVPSVILFVIASGLLTRAMEGWFSGHVEGAVSGAVEVAQHHYQELRSRSERETGRIAATLAEKPLIVGEQQALNRYLDQARKERTFFSLQVVEEDGEIVGEAENVAGSIEEFSQPPLNPEALKKARSGEVLVLFEEKNAGQFLRAYYPVASQGHHLVLVSTVRIDPELSAAFSSVNESFKQYEQLKLFKGPLKSTYILTLSMITGLIIFSAIWIGFYIAKEIAVPIQRIAEGTRAVAKGNYDFEIQATGDDEMAFLAKSFNRMTSDLKFTRGEAERRRVYIETILSNLAVGVIGIDEERRVTSVNRAAERLFGVYAGPESYGKDIGDLLSSADMKQLEPLFSSAFMVSDAGRAANAEREVSVLTGGRERKIVCTAGPIVSADGEWLGTVLLFDDITDLVQAQQMSAWREVARRIAHEIKNPLTPIQLCAQRLQKRFQGVNADPVVLESTQMIVEHVHSIKRLADEFSKFARMPAVEFRPANLNHLISDTLSAFAESHPSVVFQCIVDNDVPDVSMDVEQIRRIIINLVDNAVAALLEDKRDRSSAGGTPKITVRTQYFPERQVAMFEVADNGPGIPTPDKRRVFEPYFTTRSGGTGLGLAIVTSIVSDHSGEIRVFDNDGGGTRFVVELPKEQRPLTQRRFAAG